MDIDVRKKFNLSIYALIYLLFICGVILSDYIYYITKIEYKIAMCISAFIIVIIAIWYIKKVGCVKTQINVLDFFFISVLIIVCFLRGIMPDNSFDTSNYHIYFQDELGRNFINDDFFAVRAVNAHTLVLGDRMFGVFRRALGYRMGTMLNTVSVVLIYLQLKKVIFWFCDTINWNPNNLGVSIIAILCLQTENIYALLATYMIDLLVVPLLLQMLLVVCEVDEQDDNVKGEVLWLCIMAGMSFCMKMSNLFIVIPLALLYLYKRWRRLNINIILVGMLVFVLTFTIYIYISYDLTDNPLFPYMNGVFKSQWFSTELSPNDFSGFKNNFGPNGLLEMVFWPLCMVIRPERASDIPFCSGRLLIITISMMALDWENIIDNVKKRRYSELLGITFIYYLFFLVIFRGYMRYIILLELLGSIIVLSVIGKSLHDLKKARIVSVLGICLMFCGQIYYAGHNYFVENWEWAWRNILDEGRRESNIKMIFKDYESGIEQEILDDIETLLVVDYTGSLSYLLKPEAKIINLNSACTNETTANELSNRISKLSSNGIYCLQRDANIKTDDFVDLGLRVTQIISVQPNFCDSTHTMSLLKIEKNTEIESIECQQSDSVIEFDLSTDDYGLELFLGNNAGGGLYNKVGYDVTISLYDEETDRTKALEQVNIDRIGEYNKLDIEIDPSEGWDKIVLTKNNLSTETSYVYYSAILQRYESNLNQ